VVKYKEDDPGDAGEILEDERAIMAKPWCEERKSVFILTTFYRH
jgi:hypothetical protein